MLHLKFLLLAGIYLLLSAPISAQNTSIQSQVISGPCRFDITTTVVQSATHYFYQTTNNEFDGSIDSSFCASFSGSGPYFLDLADYDFDKVLFIAPIPDAGDFLELTPYENFLVDQFLWFDDVELDLEAIATDTVFSGFRVGYEFFDGITGQQGQRETVFVFDDETSTPYPEESNFCFYSERFTNQQFTHLVAALKMRPTGPNPMLTPYNFGLKSNYQEAAAVSHLEIFAPGGSTGPFEENLYNAIRTVDPGASEPFYLRQQDTVLPGKQNFRYTDVNLISDAFGPQELVIYMDFQAILRQPPFTGLRGGLVDGQDSVRHNLTLDVLDPFFADCFSFFLENRLPAGVTYRFSDAVLEFGAPENCFLLESGAALGVAENAHLRYGQRGVGLLATKKESRIDVEDGATFTINVLWHLAQNPLSGQEEDTHVYLGENSRLEFGEKARLERSHPDGQGYLYVHLAEGAEVDLQHLNPAERALIKFVEPNEVAVVGPGKLLVYPNPVTTKLSIKLPGIPASSTATIGLFDAFGRLVLTNEVAMSSAPTTYQFPLPPRLPVGTYTVQLKAAEQFWMTTVMKQE